MPEDEPRVDLAKLFLQLEANAAKALMEEMERRLSELTYVGGKRVAKQKLPALPAKAAATVHRVKASLHGAKPPIWRRLELPSTMPLNLVHEVMQIAFEWHGYHLHSFETVCGEFGSPGESGDWSRRSADDESAVTLVQVAAAEGAKVVYTYDFGDDWRHDIVAEKVIAAEPGARYPRCTAGRGAAPPEDCGGIWAYNDRPGGGKATPFDAGDMTERLAGLAVVVVPAVNGEAGA